MFLNKTSFCNCFAQFDRDLSKGWFKLFDNFFCVGLIFCNLGETKA